ncbi:MAG: hypothetical protein HQK87_02495 [Nitrospinae bacterium]|nr:hypothetical protein [Nitrospinota bacterium]
MTLSLGADSGSAAEKSFMDHYVQAREQDSPYVAPTRAEFDKARALFEQAFRGKADDALTKGFATLGFAVVRKKTDKHNYLIVEEFPDRRRGGGFYLIRLSSLAKKEGVLLTAPHTFHDEGTGKIARVMFLITDAAGAGFNTVHRYSKSVVRGEADLAHVHISYFQAFILAWAATHPEGIVAQIHGYDRANRISPRGKEAGMIVSAGTDLPSPTFMKMRERLRKAYGESVLFFPFDTNELTAVENTNGQALREKLFPGFIHIELSEVMRDKLNNDKNELKRLYGALSK